MMTMAKNKMAMLISAEGPDGVGKSSNIKNLARVLASEGNKVAIAKLPSCDTFVGRLIKRTLQNGLAVRWPNVFQIIQCLDKLVFQFFVLPAMMKRNDYVLLDRWHASMWAYGLASGASEWLTNACVSLMIEPHAVLVFHGTCKRAVAQDDYEKDKNFQKSVALHYVLWTVTRSNNSIVIHADRVPAEVHCDVLNAVYSIV